MSSWDMDELENTNFFDVFGISVSFSIDEAELTSIYMEKQRQFHPDITGDDSFGDSALINVAYSTLMNPVSRAEYFLLTKGIQISSIDSNKFASEMFCISEKYNSLMTGAEKEEFRKKISIRMSDLVRSLSELENDLPQFYDNFCLLRFIYSFLEKEAEDAYCGY